MAHAVLADPVLADPVLAGPVLADPVCVGSEALRRVDGLNRPVALAKDQLMPVGAAFLALLPDGGLRRGSTVTVSGSSGTSLALGLVAEASRTGSWVAMVGLPWVGLLAAEEHGVELGRVAIIDDPGNQWSTVVAALVGAFDVVLTCAPNGVRAADRRRLSARLRERGTVLVQVPEPTHGVRRRCPETITGDVVLTTESTQWEGLGDGHGHLRSRRVEVSTGGRGAAARGNRAWLWLPHPDGGARGVDATPPTTLRPDQKLDSLEAVSDRLSHLRAVPDPLSVPEEELGPENFLTAG